MKTLNEYQADAMRTAPREPGKEVPPEVNLMIWSLGLAGESGEVADLVKKQVGHGHPADRQKMVKELGDVLWYLAVLASTVNATLEEVAEANIAKLRERYPDGFREVDSLNRRDGAA